LAILDGDLGLGKSLVTLDLCARLTRGRRFPNGTPAPAGSVVIVNCEDGVADTIRPRLDALGADLGRVHLFRGRVAAGSEQLPSFPRDPARLERAVRQVGAVLVIIDPIMAFFDETVCTGNDQSVRQTLAPLARLAEETTCAVLLVRHLNETGLAFVV
jgi:RecA-family ATPase